MENIEQVKAHYCNLISEIIDTADSLNTSRPLSKMTSEVMIMQRAECSMQIKEVASFLASLYSQLQTIAVNE